MKRALNSPGSPLFITLIWIFTLFVCGYWFRAAELTACQVLLLLSLLALLATQFACLQVQLALLSLLALLATQFACLQVQHSVCLFY